MKSSVATFVRAYLWLFCHVKKPIYRAVGMAGSSSTPDSSFLVSNNVGGLIMLCKKMCLAVEPAERKLKKKNYQAIQIKAESLEEGFQISIQGAPSV